MKPVKPVSPLLAWMKSDQPVLLGCLLALSCGVWLA